MAAGRAFCNTGPYRDRDEILWDFIDWLYKITQVILLFLVEVLVVTGGFSRWCKCFWDWIKTCFGERFGEIKFWLEPASREDKECNVKLLNLGGAKDELDDSCCICSRSEEWLPF